MDQKTEHMAIAAADLDTPVVTILLDRLENNIARVQRMVSDAGRANRPHIKTHKIPAIGRMQIEAGAAGLTCQKLGEAEIFIDAGVTDDLLITFNIVGAAKTGRLMDLSERIRRLAVVADNETVLRGISEAAPQPRPRRARADRMRWRLRPQRRAVAGDGARSRPPRRKAAAASRSRG